MKEKQNKIDRRHFLKTLGAAGVGSVLGSAVSKAEPNAPAKARQGEFPQVPRRKLGKTGINVSSLSLGMMFNVLDNQIVLRKTLDWGVNYWDTAHGYSGGNSELGVGRFFKKNPGLRKEVFLVSKATHVKRQPTPQARVKKAEERINESLRRMNTDYIDLYYGIHGIEDPTQLDDEMRRWAENAKKQGKIRFFGFSTHKNMAACLNTAARLDWIDALMTVYSFRFIRDEQMNAAVEACHKKGIGLIAMKVVAVTSSGRRHLKENGWGIETEEEKKLLDHFIQKGFTPVQAKIKAVLEDERFSSACVRMGNVALLAENAAGVLDKTKLSRADKNALDEYARNTCSGFCAGCANICESALPDMPYVSDIMRYLMYYNSYGDKHRARELFAQIPADVRNRLLKVDYGAAEAACPQRVPIAKAVAEAVSKLA